MPLDTFTAKILGDLLLPADVNTLQTAVLNMQGRSLDTRPASPLPNFALGVSTHIDWGQSIATVTAEIIRHANDGVRIIRSDISWRAIETAKGVYSSTALDKYRSGVSVAQQYGIVIIFTFFEVPDWAHSPSTDWYKPPTNFQDARDFAAYIAGVFKGAPNVVWGLWNEGSFFGDGSATGWWHPFGCPTPFGGNYPAYTGTYSTDETTVANAYADFATYLYKGVKSVAPHQMCLGVATHLNAPNYVDKVYLRLESSWGGVIPWDAVDIHPYCSNRDPYDTSVSNESFLLAITDTKAKMELHKDYCPIWMTEFGYNSGSAATPPLAGADDAARDLLRGAYFEKALEICRMYPYVRCLCLFTPSPVEDVSAQYDFTLYKAGANLPSYNLALARARSMLGGRVAATAAVSASGYSVGSASWWPVVFKGVDVEDTNNMHYTSDSNINGTVRRTNGSATLAGTGTAFKTDLAVGQVILIGVSGATTHVVTAIASDTSCTISPAYTGTSDGAGVVAQRRADYLVAPYAGAYTVVGWFQIPANATGIRMGRFNVNGTAIMTQGPTPANSAQPTGFSFGAKLNLKMWDRVSMDAYQDSGGALTIPAATAGLSLVRDASLPW